MLVLIASLNPVKIEAVKISFARHFPDVEIEFLVVDAPSGVPNQPIDDDTYQGAENRAEYLVDYGIKNGKNAKYHVSIEGGIVKMFNRWMEVGSVCIIDDKGHKSFGNTPAYELPREIVQACREGKELGTVIDEMIGSENIKQKGGAIAFFSNGVLNRTEVTAAVDVALIPQLHIDLYWK